MTRARDLASLLDSGGDIVTSALDNISTIPTGVLEDTVSEVAYNTTGTVSVDVPASATGWVKVVNTGRNPGNGTTTVEFGTTTGTISESYSSTGTAKAFIRLYVIYWT